MSNYFKQGMPFGKVDLEFETEAHTRISSSHFKEEWDLPSTSWFRLALAFFDRFLLFGATRNNNNNSNSTTINNNTNIYNGNVTHSTEEKREENKKDKEQEKNGIIAAFVMFLVLSAVAIVAYPYFLLRVNKLVNNLLEGRKKTGSFLQLFGITVGAWASVQVGLVHGVAWMGALFGLTLSPLMATLLVAPLMTSAAALVFKHALRLSAKLWTGRSNLDPYSLSAKAKERMQKALGIEGKDAERLVEYCENRASHLKERGSNRAANYWQLKKWLKYEPGQEKALRALYSEFLLDVDETQEQPMIIVNNRIDFIVDGGNSTKQKVEAKRRFEMQRELVVGFKKLSL